MAFRHILEATCARMIDLCLMAAICFFTMIGLRLVFQLDDITKSVTKMTHRPTNAPQVIAAHSLKGQRSLGTPGSAVLRVPGPGRARPASGGRAAPSARAATAPE